MSSSLSSLGYRLYKVSKKDKEPLLGFILEALRTSGCTMLHTAGPDRAPFRISFVAPWGERMGIVVYAFYANSKLTKNRPTDEWRFQVKYGSSETELHTIWDDPFGIYTTLMIGISPEEGFFVGVDPILHNPTRFFISIEFKESHVERVLRYGWHVWERVKRRSSKIDPIDFETLVGATPKRFLSYVLFEREAKYEEAGHRKWVAAEIGSGRYPGVRARVTGAIPDLKKVSIHTLEREFELPRPEILDLIRRAPRLKQAVRGWVAEEHLRRVIAATKNVSRYEVLETDGRPDFQVFLKGVRKPVFLECKNVGPKCDAKGRPKVDFQKTRASKKDPCTRYYSSDDFDLLAACLHPVSKKWEFRFKPTWAMNPHNGCAGKLDHLVRVESDWPSNVSEALTLAVSKS